MNEKYVAIVSGYFELGKDLLDNDILEVSKGTKCTLLISSKGLIVKKKKNN